MNKLNVCIIDYGVGNVHSVANAISFLGYKVIISSDFTIIKKSDALILPGVGAFEAAVNNLKNADLKSLLDEQVLALKKPILGICVGMQMMASISEENGIHQGLNWIKGRVVRLQSNNNYPVPHVGWNTISPFIKKPLFIKADENSHFYFDHSYHFIPEDSSHLTAIVNYGGQITAAVQSENIFGVQFHPEKSQSNGLKLFRSFMNSFSQYA
jgi:glutamine amidotransferase